MADQESDYTQDPDLFESDLPLRGPLQYQEAGLRSGKASRETLHPCPTCGSPVIRGALASGQIVTVETDCPMYILLWKNREEMPQLTQSRGYPQHTCQRRAML